MEAYQLAKFLNVDGSDIVIGGNTLEGNVQDNGFSVQNEDFDFMLGLDDRVIHPADGEVYAPISYMRQTFGGHAGCYP